MIVRLIFSVGLSIVLIYIISRAIKIEDLLNIILSFPKDQLALFFALSSIIIVLKAWRFLIYLKNSDINISFLETLRVFIAGQAITPLPGGEAARGILIKKETGIGLKKTSGSILTQAYIELFSASLVALVGSLYFKVLRIPVLVVFIAMAAIALFFINNRIHQFVLKKINKVKFIKKHSEKFLNLQQDFRRNFFDQSSHLPDKTLTKTLLISLLSHILGGVLIMLIAKSYGVDINILISTFVYSGSLIIQGLTTFSPGGLGLTEGGMVGILLLFNVDFAKALAIVILFRFVTLFFYVVLGLIFLLLFYSKTFVLAKKRL